MPKTTMSFTILEDLSTLRPGPTVVFEETDVQLHRSGSIKKALAGLYGVAVTDVIQTHTFYEWQVAYLKEQVELHRHWLENVKSNQEPELLGDTYSPEEIQQYLEATSEALEDAERNLAMCQYPPVEPYDGPWCEQHFTKNDSI